MCQAWHQALVLVKSSEENRNYCKYLQQREFNAGTWSHGRRGSKDSEATQRLVIAERRPTPKLQDGGRQSYTWAPGNRFTWWKLEPWREQRRSRNTLVSSLFPHFSVRPVWQPTPVFLPRESHGGRSLVGYSPWGGKESDTTERLHFHFSHHSKVVKEIQNLI